jgi:membrane protein DedA with SNARE-associated domain
MSTAHLTQLIVEYRYWILVPLAMLEGPIVAFFAGTLASLGYFNIYLLAVFFFARDIIMDGGYYALGHFGYKTRLAKWLLKKIGVTPEHLEQVRLLWERNAGKTMFFGKLSYGIASSFIVVAGIVRMPLKKFFAWGALVAILQYGTLLLLGYFFGNAFGGKIETILNNIQYLIAGASVFIVGYLFFTHYMRRRTLKQQADEEADEAPTDTSNRS